MVAWFAELAAEPSAVVVAFVVGTVDTAVVAAGMIQVVGELFVVRLDL